MSSVDRRGSGFGPMYRLPEEVQALLGTRVLDQVPPGPIRESVEGYLAIPESKRGPKSMARTILADAIKRERAREREVYRPNDAYLNVAAKEENGATLDISAESGDLKERFAPRPVTDDSSGHGRFPISTPHLGTDVPSPSPATRWRSVASSTKPNPAASAEPAVPEREATRGKPAIWEPAAKAVEPPAGESLIKPVQPPVAEPAANAVESRVTEPAANAVESAKPEPDLAELEATPPKNGESRIEQSSRTAEQAIAESFERASRTLPPARLTPPLSAKAPTLSTESTAADSSIPKAWAAPVSVGSDPAQRRESMMEPEPVASPDDRPEVTSIRSSHSAGLRFEFVEPDDEAPAETTQGAGDKREHDPIGDQSREPQITPPHEEVADGVPDDPDSWRQVIDPYGLQEARRDLEASPAGWRTGFAELDNTGFKFLPGHLYMVHAPSGGGKTAVLLELLRRHMDERSSVREAFWPALLVSASQSRAETYTRLLLHVAQNREQESGADSVPSGAVVREWVRSGIAPTPELALLLEASARHLDRSVRDGQLTLTDGGRDGLPIDTLVDWFDSGRAEMDTGPSLVLVDDAHRLSLSAEVPPHSPERQRLDIVRRLRQLANGGDRGPMCAAPVIFSVPTASGPAFPESERIYAEELAAEATAILRVDEAHGSGSPTITVEKNNGGPRGWMFPVRLYTSWARGA